MSESDFIDCVTLAQPDAINAVEQCGDAKEIYAEMILGGRPVRFHIDCGATVNVLPAKYVESKEIKSTKKDFLLLDYLIQLFKAFSQKERGCYITKILFRCVFTFSVKRIAHFDVFSAHPWGILQTGWSTATSELGPVSLRSVKPFKSSYSVVQKHTSGSLPLSPDTSGSCEIAVSDTSSASAALDGSPVSSTNKTLLGWSIWIAVW
ncbi:hypothetical protein P5673_030602 [Acropora cervicornis]|uniref:Uncharacterized protein n=1 Tax=Acropora cervicornis TaxID=6130 RepID=A0AAD9PTV0_ACRCE|nr:hypothetical protein P5673_030602 [Acropora cervicornis]